MLVDGTYSHPRGGRPMETHPEDPGPPSWFQTFRSRVFLGQGYTAHSLPLSASPGVMFLPDELSYQDVWQQPFLLTVAYAWELQYWVKRLNLPKHPDFCPLGKKGPRAERKGERACRLYQMGHHPGLRKGQPRRLPASGPNPTPTGFGRVDPPLSPHVCHGSLN